MILAILIGIVFGIIGYAWTTKEIHTQNTIDKIKQWEGGDL